MVLTGHLAEEAEQVLGDINEHVDAMLATLHADIKEEEKL